MNTMTSLNTNPIEHTPGHRDCPACTWASIMHETPLSPQQTFAEAFDVWISRKVIDHQGVSSNARYISERTERDLRQYARAAGLFFGELPLSDILVGHLREYQRARATCDKNCGRWHAPAGANLIRKEIGLVIRILKAAGAWTPLHEEGFEPLQSVENDVPRALSPDEQHRWLKAAASRETWRVVYWWSIVALQTTAGTNEMRALRLGDIFLNQGTMQIRTEGAKNKFRVRTIPLSTPEVAWALDGLMQRAARLKATMPWHYLFPFHQGQTYDPERPMTVWGLRKAWDGVRAASGIEWFEPRDLRHTAITRMAEAGVPIQVIMSFAGHISPRMQQHYTAISMQAKRRWAAAAWANADMPYMAPLPGLPAGYQGPGTRDVGTMPDPHRRQSEHAQEREQGLRGWMRERAG